MPSPSASPVTLPNSVSTPTCPVGTETTLANSRITTNSNPNPRNSLDPNPPRFLGIVGKLLSRSNLRVPFVIANLRIAQPRTLLLYYAPIGLFLSPGSSLRICQHTLPAVLILRSRFRSTRSFVSFPQLSAARGSFPLTPDFLRFTLLLFAWPVNLSPSQGAHSCLVSGRLLGEMPYVLYAGLDCSVCQSAL